MTELAGEMPDLEVVRRIQRGDRESYRVLVHRYQDVLYRFALPMVRDPDHAADLVQATFTAGYLKLSSLRDGARFGGWLYRMCVNSCRDHLKSGRRRDVALEEAPNEALASPALADVTLERRELGVALGEALAGLNQELREAFVMKHVDELSYEEMADVLKVSVPALKMRVHRARESLKNSLEEVL